MRLSNMFISFCVDNTYARHSVPSERPEWWGVKKEWALEVLVFIVTMMMEDKSEKEKKSGITSFDYASKYRGGGMQMFLHSFPDYYVDDAYFAGEYHTFWYTNGVIRITLNRADSKDLEQVCSKVFDLNGEAGYSRILSDQGKIILLREWEETLRQELIQYRAEYSGAMVRKITEYIMMVRNAIKSLEG